MKNVLLTVIALFFTNFVNAQFRLSSEKEWYRTEQDEKKFSFGYYLGVNYMSYKVDPKAYVKNKPENQNGVNENGFVYLRQDSKPGFSVGVTGKMKLTDHFALKIEPGVHFVQRTLHFNNLRYDDFGTLIPDDDPDYKTETDISREVKSTYIDIPLLLNFSGERWVNTRPYLQAGLGYSYNLQSNEDKKEDNSANVFRTTASNFNWQAEMGIDIYFKRFKLTPSLKGIFFFNNELKPDNIDTEGYANTLNSLKTRAVVFSLKFE